MAFKSDSHIYITMAVALVFVVSAFTLNTNQTTSSVPFQDGEWTAPASAKKLKNPTPNDKNSIKRGKALYKTRCAVCHGESGFGDGPGSKALNPKPADHTSAKVHKQLDGELFWKISEGRGNMIGWKLILAEKDRWDLVNYIRTLKK